MLGVVSGSANIAVIPGDYVAVESCRSLAG